MMILDWKRKRKLIDDRPPAAPYYLTGEDLLIHKNGREIFVKHIYSVSKNIPKYGPVIMCPGLSSNANLFRIDNKGKCLFDES